MDLMSQAVEQMRLLRVRYCEHARRAPWSALHEQGAAGIHLVVSGRSVLQQDAGTHELGPGDLVIVPRSLPHALGSVRAAEREEGTQILTGTLEFEAYDHPLLTVLPPVIHGTPAELRANTRGAFYVEQIVDEVRSARDGGEALVTRLTEVLLIEVMRFFTPPPGVECPVRGWFGGLRDPAVRRALTAMHENPGGAWTVDSLARVAGQSRSAFAAHFTNIMLETPVAYLTRWRMFQSRTLLRQTELPLDAIASRIGYGSAAAFSLAFVREHGTTPGNYRRATPDKRGISA